MPIEPESPRLGFSPRSGACDESPEDASPWSISPYTAAMVATRNQSDGPQDAVPKEGPSRGGRRKNVDSPNRGSPPDAPLRKRSINATLNATVNVSAHVAFEDDMDAWAADVLLRCSQEGASHEVICYDDCPHCIAACPLKQVDPRDKKAHAYAEERPTKHGGECDDVHVEQTHVLDEEEGAKVAEHTLALHRDRDEYVVLRQGDNVSALTFVYFCKRSRNDYMYVGCPCMCVNV